ncbi:adenylate/guanylate cyclase domain-containing protein [Mesorhizobium sp. M0213]|uniref:adenylate/guanylate cyclase domain-containing protein n=1 Tax=Mesorhizobium sp. M0213 TaxID=2956917 RepID=UPI0033374E4B
MKAFLFRAATRCWRSASRYLSIGSQGVTERGARRIAIINAVAGLSAVNGFFFLSVSLFLGSDYLWINLSLLFFAGLFLLTPLALGLGFVVAVTYLWLVIGCAILLWTFTAGTHVGSHYFLLAAPPLVVMVLGPGRRVLAAFYVFSYVGMFILIERYVPRQSPFLDQPSWFINFSFTWAISTAATVNLVTAFYAFQRAETAEDALEAEHKRSEQLLNSLLPSGIAARLKDRPQEIIADDLPSVTILFADLVDFTPRVSLLQADSIILLLTRIFSEFDKLAEKYGLEKIKTNGDAYMVAGGLPNPRPDHAAAVADMALEMLSVIRQLAGEFGEDLAIRVGIDSGPAIAGVIASRKPFYDVWGDTVNMAARMESHGIAGKIQVTSRAKDAIGVGHCFEERGFLEVKGKGKMLVHFLMERDTP